LGLLLYINGQLLDLDPSQAIAQTKQVNDLNSLDNRQANYTNKFKVPKTATNVKIMQFLSFTGNRSAVPYQKNECSLYSETGECFVYKGQAVVTDGGDDFDVVVYDGIISLYKEIENKSLSELGLSDLTHVKTVQNVIATWSDTFALPYKYILADYNGQTTYDNNKINIDYLVPAVSVEYLWKKIFSTYNATYSGAVFTTQNFKNLWMTYPKGVVTSDSEAVKFESTDYGFQGIPFSPFSTPPFLNKLYAKYKTFDTYEGISDLNGIHLKVYETGVYRLEISGNLKAREYLYMNNVSSGSMPSNFKITIGKNAESYTPVNVPPFEVIINNHAPGQDFSASRLLPLNQYESLCLVVAAQSHSPFKTFYLSDASLEVRLVKVNSNEFNFANALSDFAIKDFFNEVVHRFGLTMFKDKYSNNYKFLTLQEQLQAPVVTDWSGKFSKKIAENYIYGNYAQQNWLRYNYNDKESTYNDSAIEVKNVNLQDSRDAIKSKIYSPEKEPVDYFGIPSNVYRLWDKEVVENPDEDEEPVKYKSLDKRYYFLRYSKVEAAPFTIGSVLLGEEVAGLTSKCAETFYKLSFEDIRQDYYGPLQQILDHAALVTAEMYLTEADIAKFDFKKLYYIEQLSSYFIVNKINGYVQGKPVNCELVRVHYAQPGPALTASISGITADALNRAVITFTATQPYTLQLWIEDGPWINYESNPGSSPYTTWPLSSGNNFFRLALGDGSYSNTVEIEIP
jgi:hypothetical protein